MLPANSRAVHRGRLIAIALVLVAAAVGLAGCGDNDEPSPQEASNALHKIDNAVVQAHNAVTDELRTSKSCLEGAGIAVTRCEKTAKRSIKSLAKIRRRLHGVYEKTPTYARKIYSAAYRSEMTFQDATKHYQYVFLRFTRLDYKQSDAKRHLKSLGSSEVRSSKHLKKARSNAEKYIAEL